MPSQFSFCVSDCQQAHYAYVNNPITSKCVYCGNHSTSCNLKYGSEECQAETAVKPYVSLNTLVKYDGTNNFYQCT